MLQGMTAHYLSHATFPLRGRHTCLVHAAAGGVGLSLVPNGQARRSARHRHRVDEQKAALAQRAGADDVVLYTTHDFETEARRITAGAASTSSTIRWARRRSTRASRSLAPRGMLVLFGQSSGRSAHSIRKSSMPRLSLPHAPHLGHYVVTREDLLARANAVLAGSSRASSMFASAPRSACATPPKPTAPSRAAPPRAKWCSSLERDACRPV